MDKLIASNILYEILVKSKGRGFDKITQGQEIFPFILPLNYHMHDTYNTPVLLSFGINYIITAMFVVKDNQDIKKLLFDARVPWLALFKKLQEQVGEYFEANQSAESTKNC